MINVIFKSVAAVIGCLILGDLAGMIFLVVIEILPFDLFSGALPYVVWFVFGVFTGLIAFNVAGTWSTPAIAGGGDWTNSPRAQAIGRTIVVMQTSVIAGLNYLFYRLYWSQGVAGDYYVPDSAPHSITYFVAVLGAIIFGSLLLMPKKATR